MPGRLSPLNPAFAAKLEQRRADRAVGATLERPLAPDLRACVLVVDDEPEITASVAELLGRDYRVLTAGSADEALALLRENEVAVILTDQRMPNGTGAELLARSLDIAPETTRVLFTGYSDISAVIDAVNEGQVYHYLAKPWRPEELKAVLGHGLERYRLVLRTAASCASSRRRTRTWSARCRRGPGVCRNRTRRYMRRASASRSSRAGMRSPGSPTAAGWTNCCASRLSGQSGTAPRSR